MNNKYITLAALAISLLYVDLFCGAGGTSTGVETAKIHNEKCAKVIVCVNHDPKAIASHAKNHPDSVHYTEDIRTVKLAPIVKHVNKMRKLYPFAKVVLWASLECTNHSKAKGGMSRDADSRTLADHLFRYFVINPDSIQIENVEEFLIWGPLEIKVVKKNNTSYCPLDLVTIDKKKKIKELRPTWIPIKERKAEFYNAWISKVQEYGFQYDYRLLNAADFGAYTSRKRYFAQFNKPDFPTAWPEQTHARNPKPQLFENLEKWKPVRDLLDFKDEGKSIFDRKKPMVEASLERIYHGLIKFVAGGKEKWLLKYNSVNGKTGKHIPPSIEEPCPTVSCQGRLGVVSTNFLTQYNSGSPEYRVKGVDEACNAVTTNNRFAKVECNFLSKYYSGNPEHKNISVDGPSGTITTVDSHALIVPNFLTTYYGTSNPHSVESPSPTVTTKDRISKIKCDFIDQQFGNSKPASVETVLGAVTTNPKYAKVSTFIMNQYSNGGQSSDINAPSPTILATPKQNLVTCSNWLMNTNFKNIGSHIENPTPTITANRKWHYLMDAQYGRIGNTVDQPCFTLIARMDKTPPYLVEFTSDTNLPSFIKIIGNCVVYEIYESDTPMMKMIKEFMAMYGLTDIKMRMLKIQELKEIMGFPKDYVLIGNQADQKKFIGNAVEVTMARKICEATAYRIFENRKAA
jgi:DNA (cytosine-5)-methyltransferase 1